MQTRITSLVGLIFIKDTDTKVESNAVDVAGLSAIKKNPVAIDPLKAICGVNPRGVAITRVRNYP